MYKFNKLSASVLTLLLAAMATSCSDDNDDLSGARYAVIDFENSGVTLAGPTSYGANLYAGADGQFTEGEVAVTDNIKLHFGINESMWTEEIDFYGGGMALSKWNHRTSIDGKSAMWWYSYENQCSVYNVNSTDGANNGAGADGSDTFAVIFGYRDNNSMSNRASMNFTGDAELQVRSIALCSTSYVYGTLMNPNPYGITPDKNIEEAKGWFMIQAYGFDADGNPTNGGQPVEKYICDYRDDANPKVPAINSWQIWDVSALGKVNKIEFDFKGSDVGTYGLNTPAYACLDNIMVELP